MDNVQNGSSTEERDAIVLKNMKKFLGLEHFGWKLSGFMMLAACVTFIVAAVLIISLSGFAVSQANLNSYEKSFAAIYMFIVMGGAYLFPAFFAFLPGAIIDFVMLKKVEYYQSTTDTDISIARKRCSSVGMIVFCVCFSGLAAVFYIINFVKTKKNSAAFDRLEAKKQI